MKYRQDFVTNSSSSSFVLAFKDKKELIEFAEYCNDFDYRPLFRLVERLAKVEDNITKQAAINILLGYFKYDVYNLYSKASEHFRDVKFENQMDYIKAYDEFIENQVAEIENDEKYLEAKKKIEDAGLVVTGTIWDGNGGLLEYAIRNGLLTSEFRKYCVASYNVG